MLSQVSNRCAPIKLRTLLESGIIPTDMHHIGQLNEQPLHAALKAYYAHPDAQTEVLVDGYHVDVVRKGVLIEIQTGNFSAIKRKLGDLVPHHPLTLVYPIAVEKWILKYPQDGALTPPRRKSPKRGRPVDLFAELVSFPGLAVEPNFTLELALIQEEELRRYTGEKRWRRGGWETIERRLIQVLARRTFRGPAAFAALLPPDLPEAFTTADIAAGLPAPLWLAQKAAYCLREMGAIQRVGKGGRSWLYARVDGM
jgi:hypothetical protein